MKEKISSLIGNSVPGAPTEVTVPEDPKFGHYSTNIAFDIGRREKISPRAAAERLVPVFAEAGADIFEKVEVAAGGFINFWLKDSIFREELEKATKEPASWGNSDVGRGRTVVVEYFQLNVAKVPHIGHLRSAVIGDALKRILLALGYRAVSDTHIGDWGTQFGMLLYGYKKLSEEERADIQADPFEKLNQLYIDTNSLIEGKPELRETAKNEFAKLERGDDENRKIWKWMVEISMKKLGESGARLGLLEFEEHRGESAYEGDMPAIVELALDKGVAKKGSDGAVLVDLTAEGLDDAVLIKSDGASTYLLRDLATIRYRKAAWKFHKNLYVVDTRQNHHFRQVFRVAELLGFEGAADSVHVNVGFMSLPEGPMSTRKGTTIPLNAVIDDVIGKAREIIEEKNPDLGDKGRTAQTVGVGALKFFDLLHHRQSDIVFDREKSLSLDGATAPYLQYTYARLSSILRKDADAEDVSGAPVSAFDGDEKILASIIARFPDEMARSAEEWAPNVLANYLLELARQANNFYHSHPVVSEKDRSKKRNRKLLVETAATTIKRGLYLLGIEVSEEM